jgi:siroheme synthase-like protein
LAVFVRLGSRGLPYFLAAILLAGNGVRVNHGYNSHMRDERHGGRAQCAWSGLRHDTSGAQKSSWRFSYRALGFVTAFAGIVTANRVALDCVRINTVLRARSIRLARERKHGGCVPSAVSRILSGRRAADEGNGVWRVQGRRLVEAERNPFKELAVSGLDLETSSNHAPAIVKASIGGSRILQIDHAINRTLARRGRRSVGEAIVIGTAAVALASTRSRQLTAEARCVLKYACRKRDRSSCRWPAGAAGVEGNAHAYFSHLFGSPRQPRCCRRWRRANRKCGLLLDAGPHQVINETLNDELAELAKRVASSGGVCLRSALDGCRLVYAAADAETNMAVARAANARNIPINVVDDPALCTFQTPAVIDRAPVVVAIGTEGTAPVLARQIRAHLESWLPPRLGQLAALAGTLRKQVNGLLRADARSRRRFWEIFFSGRTRTLMMDGKEAEARAEAESLLSDGTLNAHSRGHVSLVGAGPGTADLMTLRALRRLQEADVIVHDRLIDPSVLECARRDARRINVGKTPGQACIAQSGINAILVAEAKAGNDVVRLKGGDPMIFGRVGEEMAALDAAGISYNIARRLRAGECQHRADYAMVRSCSHGPFTAEPGVRSTSCEPGTVFAPMAVSAAPYPASLPRRDVGRYPVTIVETDARASRTVHATLLAGAFDPGQQDQQPRDAVCAMSGGSSRRDGRPECSPRIAVQLKV